MALERRISHLRTKDIVDLENHPSETPQKVAFGVRHNQVALSYFGFLNYGIQFSSLSVALVGMTNTNPSTGPVLNYTLSDIGTISGLFVCGGMMGTIPAAYLVSVYNPMRMMCTLGGILSGTLTLFFPYVAVHWGFTVACIMRVLVGMTQPVSNSGPYAHLSQWIADQEQEKFSFVWGGEDMGSAAITAISGVLIYYAGGWPSVFYLSGGYSIVWGIICLFWGAESPATHPSISSVEKDFLQKSKTIERKAKLKWKKMITSVPLWALLIVDACDHWTAITIASLLPTFFYKVLNISVDEIGYIIAGIDLTVIICSFGVAYLADKLTRYVSANVSRKFWNMIGLCGSAIPLFLLYTAKDDVLPIILMVATYSILNMGILPGHMTNSLELAPSHSVIIASAMFFFSNLVAFTGPILAGVIIKEERDPGDWWNMWCIGALLNVFGAVVFLVFGSTEVQPWNDDEE